jgi:hypothetical protein
MHTEIIDWYMRRPVAPLQNMVEYFWEENFTDGVPNRVLPKIGFTVIFNLGKPFHYYNTQNHTDYYIDGDIFLPRPFTYEDANRHMHAFGIKFNFSFIPLVRKIPQYLLINKISHAKDYLDQCFINKIHSAKNFEERVLLSEDYFLRITEKYQAQINSHKIISEVLNHLEKENFSEFSVNETANKNFLASKTLNRYFLKFIGCSPKRAYCILRTRTALKEYFFSGENFSLEKYGYNDHSHFDKEVFNITRLKLSDIRKSVRNSKKSRYDNATSGLVSPDRLTFSLE